MRFNRLFFHAAMLLALAADTSIAQVTDTTKNDSLRKDALNVYFNCPDCDMNYVKNEITFINYIRDQKDAQLYILETSMSTGSGGDEYYIYFIGQKEFEGKNDTLKFSASPDDTEDKIRSIGSQMLKLGLMRYVAQTPLGKDISISYGSYEETNPTNVKDPWDSWVFSVNSDGYLNGEESYKYYYVYSYVDASRVTEKNRVEITANYSQRQSKFKIDDTTWIISRTNSKSLYGTYVGSINDHWSFGGSASANTSTYSNIEFSAYLYPAIEYNLFKYAESTRRQLRFKYSIGVEDNNYIDTTIYDKIHETLAAQSISVAYKVIEKWGSISASVYGSNYMHDFSKNSLSLNTNLSVRVFKGLSINLYGYVQMLHDQIGLPKGGATPEEILTQQKQLATQYYYYSSVGLTYTFGSIYNNVVNPRFGY